MSIHSWVYRILVNARSSTVVCVMYIRQGFQQCCHSALKKNFRIYLEITPENNKKPQT